MLLPDFGKQKLAMKFFVDEQTQASENGLKNTKAKNCPTPPLRHHELRQRRTTVCVRESEAGVTYSSSTVGGAVYRNTIKQFIRIAMMKATKTAQIS